MLDRYVHGDVDRISPEAPVPVLRVAREEAMPGGAGNVVRNLAALGAASRFASVIGDDVAGSELRDRLSQMDGVDNPLLLVEPGRRTPVKTRFLAQGQQLLRADDETVAPVAEEIGRELLENVAAWRGTCPVIVLSDYAKGVLLGECGDGADRTLCRHKAAAIVVDPKGADFGRYRGADVITPNRRELAIAAATPIAPWRGGRLCAGAASTL